MELTLAIILGAVAIGLLAGVFGGLAGVGGSMVILPGLHMLVGEPTPGVHHLYMASAMAVNVAVAIPAAIRHRRAGAVRSDLLGTLITLTLASIIVGVLLSNLLEGSILRVALGVFLGLYCVWNLVRLRDRHDRGDDPATSDRPSNARLAPCAIVTGLVAGLLGLGGGVIMVPMLQLVARVRLREAIATSSAVICVTATVGASLKLATLGEHNESVLDALLLALLLAPGAIIGAGIGASLTHRLPIRVVRVAITLLMLVAAWRLAVPTGAPAHEAGPPAPEPGTPPQRPS